MVIEQIREKIKNNKELFYNIVGSVGIKGLAMFVNILTLPAYLNFFEDEKILGVWFAILSIINWILTFDFGIGNGLRNYLVTTIVERDFQKAKTYISSAYLSVGVISVLIGLVGNFIIGEINWNTILNIESNSLSNSVLVLTIRLVFFAILLQLILKLVLSILYSLQKTALSNSISLISNICILIFITFYDGNDIIYNLKSIAVVYILAVNIPLFFATVFVFMRPLKESKPSLNFYDYSYSKKIIKLGSYFLVIQLTLLLINSSNQIIISYLFSPEDVVAFEAYYRLFSIFITFFSLLTIPIWSSVTKAYIENRIDWIRKIYSYLNYVALLVGVFSFILVSILQGIIDFWLGNNSIEINVYTAFSFSVYTTIMVFVYSSTCIANGISQLKPQLYCNISAATLKIPLCFLLANVLNDWNSVMIANILIMIPCVLIQPIALIKILKKKTIDIKPNFGS